MQRLGKGPARPPGLGGTPVHPQRRCSGAAELAESLGRLQASHPCVRDIGFPQTTAAGRRGRVPGENGAVIPSINGRPVISRADMGVPRSTLDTWYRNRAKTGHPEKAGRIGRTDFWYEDEWTTWHDRFARAKTETLTRPDRRGDPDDLVDAAGAARILGYANGHVIHASRNLGYFPEPDAYDIASNGRRSPRWRRSTVWTVADDRKGKGVGGGRPPGSAGAAKPHPYSGDERLDVILARLRSGDRPSATALAAEWGTSRRTAERILRAVRSLLSS